MSDPVTLYEIGPQGYWTGQTQDIPARGGAPRGWTRAAPPALGEGEFAVWLGRSWAVTPTPRDPAPEIAAEHARICAMIDAERDRRQQLDLMVDFAALFDAAEPGAISDPTPAYPDGVAEPAGVRRLQMRRDPDQVNWGQAFDLATAAILAGAPETVTPMRAEDNWNIQTTAEQVLAVYAYGGQRNAPLLFQAGALKTAWKAITDLPTLRAFDLAVEWPE